MNRSDVIFEQMQDNLRRRTDRLFGVLFVAQWVLAIVLALLMSPYTYDGDSRSLHFHVKLAIFMGGAINALPLALIVLRPGWWFTRQTVAVTQMLWSAILITVTGGRIETHFHVFGSLAFLSFYRDWRILPTATLVIAADHLARGMLWPDSVYGVANPEWWRFLEHAAWIAFEDVILLFACLHSVREMRDAAGRESRIADFAETTEETVRHRTGELQTSLARYREIVEKTAAVPFELEMPSLQLAYIAPQAAKLLGCTVEELASDKTLLARSVHPEDLGRLRAAIAAFAAGDQGSDTIDYRVVRKSGEIIYVRTLLSCAGDRVHGISIDVTRQRQLESELLQAQKLESIGRLAAGVAHELNTPIQYVSDSVQFVREAVGDLIGIIARQELALQSGSPDEALVADAQQAADAADLPYLTENMPDALDRAIEGLDRMATIVGSMKVFAHPAGEMAGVDLNAAVTSTLTVARNEYRYLADLVTDLGELPPVRCNVGEINRVILNLVINAAHAIGDVVGANPDRGRGTITVRTRRLNDHVEIAISDTGAGIPAHIRHRIFEPFFTTKPVGGGTGQGLAIAHSVIVNKHRGSLTFDTETGRGTTFKILIPIEGKLEYGERMAA